MENLILFYNFNKLITCYCINFQINKFIKATKSRICILYSFTNTFTYNTLQLIDNKIN